MLQALNMAKWKNKAKKVFFQKNMKIIYLQKLLFKICKIVGVKKNINVQNKVIVKFIAEFIPEISKAE